MIHFLKWVVFPFSLLQHHLRIPWLIHFNLPSVLFALVGLFSLWSVRFPSGKIQWFLFGLPFFFCPVCLIWHCWRQNKTKERLGITLSLKRLMLSFNRNDSYFENAEEWILRWLGRIEEKQWSKGRKESKKLVISLTSMASQSARKENDKKEIANEYTRETFIRRRWHTEYNIGNYKDKDRIEWPFSP